MIGLLLGFFVIVVPDIVVIINVLVVIIIICLGPVDNAQGGYKFMSLKSGLMIRQYSWTTISMTQEVIDRVLQFGRKNKAPQGVTICDRNENVEV